MGSKTNKVEQLMNYKKVNDDRLLEQIRLGDDAALDYLIGKYKNFVRIKARAYFLIGADHEDLVQEGMIGLFKAIRDYQEDRQASFKGFAELCITRQIITAIKMATRQKHVPLNSYVSLDKPIFDEESERTLLDMICSTVALDPEACVIHNEEHSRMELQIGNVLSSFERQVLNLYLDGWSYYEISDSLARHRKAVDNALQRIKRKLEKLIHENEMQYAD